MRTVEISSPGDRFTITLPSPVRERLDEIARRRGSSRAVVVRELVLAGLEREALVQKIAEAVA